MSGADPEADRAIISTQEASSRPSHALYHRPSISPGASFASCRERFRREGDALSLNGTRERWRPGPSFEVPTGRSFRHHAVSPSPPAPVPQHAPIGAALHISCVIGRVFSPQSVTMDRALGACRTTGRRVRPARAALATQLLALPDDLLSLIAQGVDFEERCVPCYMPCHEGTSLCCVLGGRFGSLRDRPSLGLCDVVVSRSFGSCSRPKHQCTGTAKRHSSLTLHDPTGIPSLTGLLKMMQGPWTFRST